MSIGNRRQLTAGELIHRLRIQARTPVDDGAGGSTVNFVDTVTVWAKVTTENGREFQEQKKLMPELTHLVRMRYRPGLVPDMRFVWGNRLLNILAVYDPEGTQIELLLPVQEIVT